MPDAEERPELTPDVKAALPAVHEAAELALAPADQVEAVKILELVARKMEAPLDEMVLEVDAEILANALPGDLLRLAFKRVWAGLRAHHSRVPCVGDYIAAVAPELEERRQLAAKAHTLMLRCETEAMFQRLRAADAARGEERRRREDAAAARRREQMTEAERAWLSAYEAACSASPVDKAWARGVATCAGTAASAGGAPAAAPKTSPEVPPAGG